jgi:hypothetical protein
MGCDIHDYCEIRQDDGSWEKTGNVFPYPYYNENSGEKSCDSPYDWRNYVLFGVLAGVRGEFPPICEPRGVPSDASEGYKAIVERWRGDGHSHSYFTLQELLDYPLYNEIIDRNGWVSSGEYKVFKEQGRPNGWCAGVGGCMQSCVSNAEMEQIIADKDFTVNNIKKVFGWLKKGSSPFPIALERVMEAERLFETQGKSPEVSYYTYVTWNQSLRDAIGDRWFQTLDRLKALAPEGDYSRIRMVFFFDN